MSAKKTIRKVNRNMVLFETALLIGLVSIFLENYIKSFQMNFYLKVFFIMLLFGGLFSVFFKFIEPFFEKMLSSALSKKKFFTRLIIHSLLVIVLFVLYSLFYFGVKII